MRRTSGIIAIIAGIFSVFAAGFTLFVGGIGGAFDAEGADTVVNLGWGGVAFAFLTIVFGAIAIGARGRTPGVLLIVCALAGAVLGGTFVALFMILAAVGGILAAFGSGSPKNAE